MQNLLSLSPLLHSKMMRMWTQTPIYLLIRQFPVCHVLHLGPYQIFLPPMVIFKNYMLSIITKYFFLGSSRDVNTRNINSDKSDAVSAVSPTTG